MGGQQYCTFFLNGIHFGIDVQQVQEVIPYQQMTYVPLAPLDICGLINLRGQIITVIDLQSRLAINHHSNSCELCEKQLGYNIIVRNELELVSLLVDEIEDIIELRHDNLEPPPATLKNRIRYLLEGAYKLEKGFLLILDTKKILELNEEILI